MFCLLFSLSSSLFEPRKHLSLGDGEEFLQFPQLVDHNSTEKGTFAQRYQAIFNESTNNKTVILFIGGESDGLAARGITDFSSTLIKHFGAVFFQLEHRFYGTSQPFEKLTVENYQLLTVKQAIDDLAYFHDEITKTYNLPNDAKWILVGGSYPGLLSAYARAEYPDKFEAALSSSGVVFASNKYSEFDEQISISLGQSCAAVARNVRRRIDQLLDGDDADWLLKQFGMEGIEKDNFNFVVGEMFSLGPQYGHREELCGPLEDTLVTGDDPVMALAKYAKNIFTPKYADGDSVKTYSNKDLMNNTKPNGPRSWLWQTCSELAYWQVSSGKLGIRSSKVNQKFFHDQCKIVFGDDMKIPDTDAWNQYWIPKLQKATHIYYTTGSQDPWTPTCFTEQDEIGKDCYAHTITGREIGHCSDLGVPKITDSKDLTSTRNHIIAHLDKWLADKE